MRENVIFEIVAIKDDGIARIEMRLQALRRVLQIVWIAKPG